MRANSERVLEPLYYDWVLSPVSPSTHRAARGESPLDPAALDRLLAYVDAKRLEGRMVYVTVGEAAELTFTERRQKRKHDAK